MKNGQRETQNIRISISRKTVWITTLFSVGILPAVASQDFSDWNQVTGVKRVEYRWRQNDTKGCDLEYRNLDETDKRKYKSRIVFQINGDEQVKPYTIVSFADPAPHLDKLNVCTQVTDVNVTRF